MISPCRTLPRTRTLASGTCSRESHLLPRTDWGPSLAPARCAVATSYFSTQRIPGRTAQPLLPKPRPWIDLFLFLLLVSVYRLDSDTPPSPSLDCDTSTPLSILGAHATRLCCLGRHRIPPQSTTSTHARSRTPPCTILIRIEPTTRPRYTDTQTRTHSHPPAHVQSRIVASSHCPRVIASQIPQDTHPPPIHHRQKLSPTTSLGSHQPTIATTTETTIPTLLPSRLLLCVTVASHPPRRQARHPPRLQMRVQ